MTVETFSLAQYKEFLARRIFEKNEYGSLSALLEAISDAESIDSSQHWRTRKHAFNVIAEKAPFNNSVYGMLPYHEVKDFIEQEAQAFADADQLALLQPVQPIKLAVHLEGGLVQDVFCKDDFNMDCVVSVFEYDHDLDPEDVTLITRENGSKAEAFVSHFTPTPTTAINIDDVLSES